MTSHSEAATFGRGRDALAIVTLVLVGAIIPGTIALLAGAGDIPRNDDWSYRGMALNLWSSGTLMMDGASLTFAVGQIVLAQPFLAAMGGDPVAFWVFGTVAAALTLVGGYLLARAFLPVVESLVAAGMLVAVPGYAAYSSSFMTDVPATAAQLFALTFAVRSTRGGRAHLGWLLLALVTAALGFSIRQFAVVAPVAIVIMALVAWPKRVSVWLALLVGGTLIGGIALWQMSLPGQVGALPPLEGGTGRVASLAPTIGFMLLPLTLLAAARDVAARRALMVSVVIMATVLLVIVANGALAFTPGNLMGPTGVPTDGFFIGGRPRLWGAGGWFTIQAIALAATVPLAYVAASRGRSLLSELRSGGSHSAVFLVVLYVVMGMGAIAAYVLRWPANDRYLWPLVVALAILVLRPPSAEARTTARSGPRVLLRSGAVVSGLMLLGLSAGYASNSWAFDAARWRAGQELTRIGHTPETVDAGYEWLGTYAPTPFVALGPASEQHLIWYERFWPEFRRCAFISGSMIDEPGFEPDPASSSSYRLFLLTGPEVQLHAFRSADPTCVSA